MALKPFNSVDGYAVSENGNIVIDANSNVTANNLTATTTANLGNVGNVTITGGSANAAVLGSVTTLGGVITNIAVTTGGDGYDFPPVVTITDSGGTPSSLASVTAVLTSGVVTSIAINSGGSGYTTPTASIAPPSPKFLRTNGYGSLSWEEVSITGGGGGGGAPGGSNTYVQFNDSGTFNGVSNLTFDKTTNALTVDGSVVLNNSSPLQFSDGANYISLQAPTSISANVNFTLPATDGANGNVLATYGNGQLFWRATTSNLTVGTRTGSTTIELQNGILNIVGRTGNIPVPIY